MTFLEPITAVLLALAAPNAERRAGALRGFLHGSRPGHVPRS